MSTHIPRLLVDLAEPPATRWRGLFAHIDRARELIDSYLEDLGEYELLGLLLAQYRHSHVPASVGAEIDAVAQLLGKPATDVLLANLYYDAFRAIMGCTAFAVETPNGPLHARNLDWWTERNILSTHTVITDFVGAPAGPFSTVGWPGFVGAFSGVAKGRFAITMNAVISNEKPALAPSIALTIRDVFETAQTFDCAVQMLQAPIAADCLLLVTGAGGERVVIERTSTRAALRYPQNGPLVVTNDYRVLDAAGESTSELHATACDRFDRARLLACQNLPADAAACLEILQDERIQMGITVQQMVFDPTTGHLGVWRT